MTLTSPPRDPHGGYDEVRRRLVQRGYLSGQLERFLLQQSLASRTALRGILLSALRAALLGGPLLGALLAVAVAGAQRPLIRLADLPLLWLYFTLPAAAVLVLLELAAALAVVGLAGRRGARSADAIRAGVVVGVPILAYALWLWWAGRGAQLGLADVAFVLLAGATALFVAWLSGLVSLAGMIGRTGEVPDRRRGTVGWLLGVVLGVALTAVIVRGALTAGPAPETPGDFPIAAEAPRLLVVGVDGMDAGLRRAIESRGGLAKWREAAARGASWRLGRPEPLDPAAVWTTLLTGVAPARHGVVGVGAQRLPGVATPLRTGARPLALRAALALLLPARTVPVSGDQRRVRTVWEITALRRPTAAVGWWASWPAPERAGESPGGYVVTERLLPRLLAGSPTDRDTAPRSLFDRLAGAFEAERARIRAEFRDRFGSLSDETRARWVWESFLIDAYSAGVGAELMQDPQVRAAFVYLPGLDILRHRLADGGEPDTAGWFDRLALVERYAGFLDELLAEELAPEPGGRTVLIAEPGRVPGPSAAGFVLVLGPGARPGCEGGELGPLDVAPLLLRLAGFPRSAEMEGRVPTACLEPGLPDPGVVPGFGRRAPAEDRAARDQDPEMLERLRSLGYLR